MQKVELKIIPKTDLFSNSCSLYIAPSRYPRQMSSRSWQFSSARSDMKLKGRIRVQKDEKDDEMASFHWTT